MSNFTVKYSTRKTLVIEDIRTKGKIEISPVSFATAQQIEKLILCILEMKPIPEIKAIIDKLSASAWEQIAGAFFYFWLIDHHNTVKYHSMFTGNRKEVLMYLDSLVDYFLK